MLQWIIKRPIYWTSSERCLLHFLAALCAAQFMFHRPLRVITTMLLLTSALVLYQFYILAQATEWSHILSISILLFSNYYTLFKLTRDRIVLGRAYKEEPSMLWLLPPPRRLCFCRFCLSVCVCVQDNSKSYGRIFLKFWGYVGHGLSYRWLNFGGDLAGILDSGSLWNFRYHCVKGGISRTAGKPKMVTPPGE